MDIKNKLKIELTNGKFRGADIIKEDKFEDLGLMWYDDEAKLLSVGADEILFRKSWYLKVKDFAVSGGVAVHRTLIYEFNRPYDGSK